jgi:antitoxin component YwqK of YwqJK toxin-antitoxin module
LLPGVAPIKGDRYCYTKELSNGRRVMHGRFQQLRTDGKVAYEGAFEEGLKTGVWTLYDEKGEIVAEKFFERGVERNFKTPETPDASQPKTKRR